MKKIKPDYFMDGKLFSSKKKKSFKILKSSCDEADVIFRRRVEDLTVANALKG